MLQGGSEHDAWCSGAAYGPGGSTTRSGSSPAAWGAARAGAGAGAGAGADAGAALACVGALVRLASVEGLELLLWDEVRPLASRAIFFLSGPVPAEPWWSAPLAPSKCEIFS
jgi:hypothetical protein